MDIDEKEVFVKIEVLEECISERIDATRRGDIIQFFGYNPVTHGYATSVKHKIDASNAQYVHVPSKEFAHALLRVLAEYAQERVREHDVENKHFQQQMDRSIEHLDCLKDLCVRVRSDPKNVSAREEIAERISNLFTDLNDIYFP